ncbi:MAG: hypothetical protein PHF24_05780, partial [Syntrophomonas sp.]|nr:hypothetical protein [Syntrophomonas sp.]
NAIDAAKELIDKKLNPEDISLLTNGEDNQPITILDPQGQNIAGTNDLAISLNGVDLYPEAELMEVKPGEKVLVAGPLGGVLATNPEDGIRGALINYGIDYEESRRYSQSVRSGKTLLVARAEEDQIMVMTNILSNNGAQEIKSYFDYNNGIG